MMLLAVITVLSQWIQPIAGAEITQSFEPPHQSWTAGHRGVDLAASAGTQVLAIGPGVVVFAGQIAGKGVISIDHPAVGLRSTYEPVSAAVHKGDHVLAGDPIGVVSAQGGHCAGLCLHLGLKSPAPDDYRNPMSLFTKYFAVLKPLKI